MAAVNRTRITAEWRRGGLALRAAALLVEAGLYADATSRMYYAILHAATAALLVAFRFRWFGWQAVIPAQAGIQKRR